MAISATVLVNAKPKTVEEDILKEQEKVSYTIAVDKTITLGGKAIPVVIAGNTIGIKDDAKAFLLEAPKCIVCSTGEIFTNIYTQISASTGTPAAPYYSNYIGSIYQKQTEPTMPGAGKRVDYFLGTPQKKQGTR